MSMGFTPLTAAQLFERLGIRVDERELRVWNAIGRIVYNHHVRRESTAPVNGRGARRRPHWPRYRHRRYGGSPPA